YIALMAKDEGTAAAEGKRWRVLVVGIERHSGQLLRQFRHQLDVQLAVRTNPVHMMKRVGLHGPTRRETQGLGIGGAELAQGTGIGLSLGVRKRCEGIKQQPLATRWRLTGEDVRR